MNRIFFGVFALGLVFAVAQGLQCYKCDLGLFCSKNVTCQPNEQCYSGVGTAALIKYSTKGCLPVSECNQTSTTMFISNINLSNFTKTCCSTDLCNLAPRGAYGSFLSIALVTLTGAMITRALV